MHVVNIYYTPYFTTNWYIDHRLTVFFSSVCRYMEYMVHTCMNYTLCTRAHMSLVRILAKPRYLKISATIVPNDLCRLKWIGQRRMWQQTNESIVCSDNFRKKNHVVGFSICLCRTNCTVCEICNTCTCCQSMWESDSSSHRVAAAVAASLSLYSNIHNNKVHEYRSIFNMQTNISTIFSYSGNFVRTFLALRRFLGFH